MSLLFITTSYPRSGDDPGGHFVASACIASARAGQVVRVIAPGRAAGVEERNGVHIEWLGGTRAFGWPGVASRLADARAPAVLDLVRTAWHAHHRLEDIARDPSIEALYAHWLVPCAYPLVTSKSLRANLYAYAHGGDVRLLRGLPSPLCHRIVQQIVDRAERIVFASHSLERELSDGLEPRLAAQLASKCSVEPPLVAIPAALADPDRRSQRRAEVRAELAVLEQQPLVVALGRLVPSKRFELVLAALALAPQSAQPEPVLLVVGDGPERARLETLARPLGERVRFVGAVDRPRALELLAAADALVHSSALEAAPCAIREARALRIPVLATPAGDVRRWASHDPGIQCVEANPLAIHDALLRTRPVDKMPSAGDTAMPPAP